MKLGGCVDTSLATFEDDPINVDPTKIFTWGRGGIVTYDGDYKIHTFFNDGSFQVVRGTGKLSRLLLVGAGGHTVSGGEAGGGGGGKVVQENIALSSGVFYDISIGKSGRGSGELWYPGDTDTPSTITRRGYPTPYYTASPGSAGSYPYVAGASGSGKLGGVLKYTVAGYYGGPGGGGDSSKGENSTSAGAGTGGWGTASNISGTLKRYGGGGGGGNLGSVERYGASGRDGGGIGGGGNINYVNDYYGKDGSDGFGGGAGGDATWVGHPDPFGRWDADPSKNHHGGSGICIIRYKYKSDPYAAKATGGVVTYDGGDTIHTFTQNYQGDVFTVNAENLDVSIFLVGGGGNGGNCSGLINAAAGGGGGQCILTSLSLTEGEYVNFYIGDASENTYFGNTVALAGQSVIGNDISTGATSGSGNEGGTGGPGKYYPAGGGGGDVSIGFPGTAIPTSDFNQGGQGGGGFWTNISGVSTGYGGGGGGGSAAVGNSSQSYYSVGLGYDGGGNGAYADYPWPSPLVYYIAASGTPNTGGGGGGANFHDKTGGQGGSGIIIIRYKT